MKLKTPPGFTIVCDTREQDVFVFPDHIPQVRGTLKSGDYSILGFETQVAVERKRPHELWQNFVAKRDRFRAEFERLQSYEYACIVIEGTLPDCSTVPNPRSKVSPSMIFGSLLSWAQRFHIHPFFCHDRRHAQECTLKVLQIFFNQHRENSSILKPRTWKDAYMDEHTELVGKSLEIFRGSAIISDIRKASDGTKHDLVDELFTSFKALAAKHYPDQDPWDRLSLAFIALNEVIVRLDYSAALARGVHARMEEMAEAARQAELADGNAA